MDSGIDVCLAADKQKLHAESVGTDEKDRDEQKSEGEYGLRIIPAKDRFDDRVRENKDQRQADERDRDRDQLDSPHEFERPGLASVEYFAQTREKRLGKRGERKGLAEARKLLGDGIKSRDRVAGEKSDGENTSGGISVDRDERNENVPAGCKLSFQICVPRKAERNPQVLESNILSQKSGDQAYRGDDERYHQIIPRFPDGKQNKNDGEDSARDIEVRDIFHFFRALEKPDREKRVPEHRSETQHVDHPIVPELGNKINNTAEQDETHKRQGDLHHHDRRKDLADFRAVMLTKGDLLGGGDAESVIGQDHEILDEGLSEGNQAEFLRADDSEKIRQDQDREKIGNGLQHGKRGEIMEYGLSLVGFGHPISFLDLTDQRRHAPQSTGFRSVKQERQNSQVKLVRRKVYNVVMRFVFVPYFVHLTSYTDRWGMFFEVTSL